MIIGYLRMKYLVLTPALQKPEGFRAKASEGEVVGVLLRTLSNTGSGVLRLSRRVNNMIKKGVILKIQL